MHENGIFVFGSKIFNEETKRDAISRLPLELSWKIFSKCSFCPISAICVGIHSNNYGSTCIYLDGTSLRIAVHSHKPWARIILANRKLRNRLNKFELAIKLGSESLARFYRKNKRKLKKERARNYLPRGEITGQSSKTTVFKTKRQGDDLIIYTKRFKMF